MPEYDTALALVAAHPRVYLDTTMVGVPFTQALHPLPLRARTGGEVPETFPTGV